MISQPPGKILVPTPTPKKKFDAQMCGTMRPSTPAQGVSALSGLNSGLKSGCIGHETIGIPFGNHMRLRNKTCANAKRHNPKLLTPQPEALADFLPFYSASSASGSSGTVQLAARLRTVRELTVALSLFAPRSERGIAERSTTIISRTVLANVSSEVLPFRHF